jgi:hypothetical protein
MSRACTIALEAIYSDGRVWRSETELDCLEQLSAALDSMEPDCMVYRARHPGSGRILIEWVRGRRGFVQVQS